ncbi:hypothetical protein BGZ99_001121 [Dissophora globulifera]|uniref:RNI-like protein n=1 Tax=Dissophora globulifera TaxID=979702 RepID=A0A9P6RP39_9FUNG|nr:hypothetical protein BGZ99_001121 [Dissophora globulifera]
MLGNSNERDGPRMQTVKHTLEGESLDFAVPVSANPATGEAVVMLQPVLDLFPDTVALARVDGTPLPFLTNADGVLMVPLRVAYFQDETLIIVPATKLPPRQQDPPFALHNALPSPVRSVSSTNPFRSVRNWPLGSYTEMDHDLSDPFSLGALADSLPDTSQLVSPDNSTGTDTHTDSGVALLAQSMPLSEQPVPRLFVVLPDARPRHRAESRSQQSPRAAAARGSQADSYNDDSDTALRTFRLYFLCDCGRGATFPFQTTHEVADKCGDEINIHNCIHVADQPGYEVLNMSQFSHQFGAYTLLLLRLFQRGISTSSHNKRGDTEPLKFEIPPLAQNQYTDVLQPFSWEIQERVSTAIKTLQEMVPGEALEREDEGAVPVVDLWRLWECVEGLQVGGRSPVETMYRTRVHDGAIRWICDKHYQVTFGYLQEDRDLLLWHCKDIIGEEDGDNLSSQLNEATDVDEDLTPSPTNKHVSFDDRTKHLKIVDALSAIKVRHLQTVLSNDNMIQQVTLVTSLSSKDVLKSITDMVSRSRIPVWTLSLVPEQRDTITAPHTATLGAPSSAPPMYSKADKEAEVHASAQSFRTDTSATASEVYANGQHICDLFVLGQVEELTVPDLDHYIFANKSPAPGDSPHLRKLNIWGSNLAGTSDSTGGDGHLDLNRPWNTAGFGSLIKAFANLTDLCLSGIYLGSPVAVNSQKTDHNREPFPRQIAELVQTFLYLPRLSKLGLSSCGIRKEHCMQLSQSLALLDNRITHLDIHNNWIEDDGLAELLWAVGRRLFALDARNTGFGDASAFALASMLQSQEHEILHSNTNGHGSRMGIYRILRLEETSNPHRRLWPSDKQHTFPESARDLSVEGRGNLVRALELLQAKELCIRFELGFSDADFASAFAGMKNLECLELLEVSYSNFGPLALAAMLRIFRATSCRIRRLEIDSTLLTEQEQKAALDEILTI